MENKVIDRYKLELEALSQDANKPSPIRCIATNTDDNSTAEAWLAIETARALLNFAYGNEQTVVDWCVQQLEDHHYVDLIAPQPDGAKRNHCIFHASELLPFGFIREELRPLRDEIDTKEL
jgi:hypothetical protein